MKGAGGGLATIPFLVLAVVASAQDLPRMRVTVDGAKAEVESPFLEDTTYRIDFAKILPELTDGHAVVRQVGPAEIRVLVDGRPRLSIPLGENAAPRATPLPKVDATKIALTEAPLLVVQKGGGKRIMIDVRALGQLTGASAFVADREMAFVTPESWARRLGVAEERLKGLNARSVGAAPDLGVTPPAENMVAWVRPLRPAFVQIYKGLADTTPAPMLGRSTRGEPVAKETTDDLADMWRATATEPALVPTFHREGPDGGVAMYAAVASAKNLGEDPVHAINAGEAGDDWAVVGTRQRVVKTPLVFRLETLRSGEAIGVFAKRTRMPVGLVLAMNGFGGGAPPKAGTRLLVIDKVVPLPKRKEEPKVVGLYEVRPGDTVEGLAARWKVDEDALCELADIQPSQDLAPGQVIAQVEPGEAKAVEKPRIAKMEAMGRIKKPTDLYETSDKGAEVVASLQRGLAVSVCGAAKGGLYYVKAEFKRGALEGFVPVAMVALEPPPADAPPPGPANSGERAIVTQALAHLGTPYNWGGNDIARGIDCSHFVAAVLSLSGHPAPSPPVSSQEIQGTIVHWKPGYSLHGAGSITFPNARYPGQPSLDRLRIGDRLIIQHPPVNQRSGGRHTGIYIGRYQGRFGNIEHAVVHAGSRGVAVVPFNHFWSDYRYTVRDAPRGRIADRGSRIAGPVALVRRGSSAPTSLPRSALRAPRSRGSR